MKRKNKLGLLMACLVLLIVGAVAAIKMNADTTAETETAESVTIFALEDGDITLSWTNEDALLTFRKSEDIWSYPEDEAFPLDDSILNLMTAALSKISATKTIENPEELSQYGLLEPQCTITVVQGDTETEILLGDETGLGGSRYLSLGDGSVYLVDSTILDDFSYGLLDLVDMEAIPDMSAPVSVTVENRDTALIFDYLADSGRAYSDSYVWFLNQGDDYVTLDTELTENYLSAVTELSWLRCVSYQADKAQLTDYGLNNPAVVVTVQYIETTQQATNETDEDGETVYETVEEEKTFVLELGDDTDEGCYARIQGSDMVYLVDSTVVDTLSYTTYQELLPDEVLLLDEETVLSVDVTLDGETYTIERELREVETASEDSTEEPEITETVFYTLDGEDTDFANVLTDLLGLSATGSVTGENPDKAEISFVFRRDTEDFPEITLTFWQYNSSDCLVALNGETRLLVSREDVVALEEAFREIILK